MFFSNSALRLVVPHGARSTLGARKRHRSLNFLFLQFLSNHATLFGQHGKETILDFIASLAQAAGFSVAKETDFVLHFHVNSCSSGQRISVQDVSHFGLLADIDYY